MTLFDPQDIPSDILSAGRMLTMEEWSDADKEPHWRLSELLLLPNVVSHCLKDTGVWLLIKQEPGEIQVHFAAVEWAGSDAHGDVVKSLWCGEGPSGNLRELRHSRFGPEFDGYMFYADLQHIILVAEKLKTWFDGD